MTPQEKAKAAGHAIFPSGVKCGRDHTGIRYTKTNACVDCVRESRGKWEREFRHITRPNKTLRLRTGKGGEPIKIVVHGTEALETISEIQGLYKTITDRRPTKALVIARALQMCAEILKMLKGDAEAVKAERAKLEALSTPPKTTQEPLKENSNAYHH